ncbi:MULTISPECIES: hypothetical protein [unclassified Desulfovibrio]|uniref:phage baseplate plug family protein n=1 Tax=unclassified Desulfovibrio TaxID=2593640 RepID=UPI0013ECE0D0|nr:MULTISPECIES: hypothetical protein [unclassified Desulfovibrio]
MALYEIPLTPEPQSIGISLAGRELHLAVRWAESLCPDAPGGWMLDIFDAPDDLAPLVLGIPLVAGCDLLRPYAYLGIGGGLHLSGDLPPTLENLGEDVRLLFETEDAAQ